MLCVSQCNLARPFKADMKMSVHSGGHVWCQEWAADGTFIPGGTPHNDLYGEAPCKGVPFLGFRYTKE